MTAKQDINVVALMRSEIERGQWDDMDVHYVCCQMIATYAAVHEIEQGEALRLVEGVKDEIEEMECYWLGEDEA